MVDENTSIRSDLEAAFEQHTEGSEPQARGSETNTPEPVRTTETPAPEVAPEKSTDGSDKSVVETEGRVRDKEGKFAKKPDGQTQPEASKATNPEAGKEIPATPVASGLNAPAGWKPVAREHWTNIPRAAQEEILRREQETAKALSHSVNARRLFDEFSQTIGPFMPLIQAQNSTPMAAVKNLMTTAAGLTVGTAQQKAQIIRDIIQNYGVDIDTLDKVLAGTPVNPQGATVNAQNTPPAWATPLFQFVNSVQQSQKQRQTQVEQDAVAETESFAASHEFFEDVREDMADYMEFAAKRGRTMTMQQAYDRACQENSDIKAVLDQRTAAGRANGGGAVARAKVAASTVTGTPRGSPAPTTPVDRRGDIAAAWDSLENR